MIADDSDKDIYHHINSTLTDEEGYYQFNGLDPMKKYYVQFEYDGTGIFTNRIFKTNI